MQLFCAKKEGEPSCPGKRKERGIRMQKIKSSVLEGMIKAGVTSKEFDFLIYISRYQDEGGRVEGVHYKDVCGEMGISFQGFYDTKRSLEEKGIISTGKSSRIDHDITIIGNSFEGVENFGESYINTNHNIFQCREFYALKAGTKLLAMEMMKISYAGQGKAVIGKDKFYEKYCGMFRVSRRIMRSYLMQLKAFFSVGLKEGKYYITPLVKVYRKPGTKTENERYAEHQAKTICRRYRMDITDDKAISDTAELAAQYKRAAYQAGRDVWSLLQEAIGKSLDMLNGACRTYKIRTIKPKLIHKIMKEALA